VIDDIMLAKPQSFAALIDAMSAEVHQQLKTAIELGKWPNGERLSADQVELCLQAVIAWDLKNLPETERVAYLDRRKLKTSHCGDA